MYEAFFGLKRRPFGATPDSQCFLASGTIQAALDEIVVCVEQGQGIAVVSAPAGTGKTLLCERLRTELGDRFESIVLRHASFLTRRALLQTILCELSHSYRQQDEQELRLELSPLIRALRPEREALVLICDEAHQLSGELLEELRILSDLAEHGRPLVRLVLVGQLGLEETLAMPGLEALSQRIRAHVSLETLDQASSLDYIDYRLTWSGGRTEEIFTPEALELVNRAADGVPRCINQLCDHALLLAYVAEQQPVPAEIIREALQDLRQLPLHWNEMSIAETTRRNVETLDTESDFDGDRFNKGLTTQGTNEIESIEFGADLPQVSGTQASHSFVETAVEHMTPIIDEASSLIEHGFESSNANAATNSVRRETCFAEELVLDRYAFIDAGLEPDPLSCHGTLSPKSVSSRSDADTSLDVPSNHSIESTTGNDGRFVDIEQNSFSMSSRAEFAISSESVAFEVGLDEIVAAESGAMQAVEGFREVCERLDDLMPHVSYESCWNSDSLHAAIEFGNEEENEQTESSYSWPVTELSEYQNGADLMEDRIGFEVRQLTTEVRRSLSQSQPEGSPLEDLDSLFSSISCHEIGTQCTIEMAVSPTVEVGAVTSMETSPIAEPGPVSLARGTGRPYRNLFSQLRRKQQGLL